MRGIERHVGRQNVERCVVAAGETGQEVTLGVGDGVRLGGKADDSEGNEEGAKRVFHGDRG